ncbi:hypothetical protein EC968_000151 [Mortierella alpina]|nr:hypothetical protein EC968_000151 [Mortierella alpina]
MSDSEELAEKYRKLLQDYSRMKAQHTILKNAVVKEQTENAAMQAAMKEKEQEVRKSLQDLDLLSFHNQRLTKRIENLQSSAAAKPGGSWLMGGGSVKKDLEKSQAELEAATIDLQAKIEENEKLHQQLYEINALYPRHVTELQGKIQLLEKQNQELQEDVQRAGVANEDTITLIRKEKEAVEKELGLIRDALAGELKDEQRAHQNLREKSHRLEDEIDRLRKVELELESLQTEHAKLQGELETFKWISSELSQLQESYNALERDKAQLERAHAQLSQQYSGLRQAEEGLRKTLFQEQEQLRLAQERSQNLMRDLDAVRGEATEREHGHIHKIEQLESELDKVRKEQDQLRVQYEELKVAERSAKEGESRTRADLAKDLSGMELSLKNAEARVKELEQVKETLEAELAEIKETLEKTKEDLALEVEKRASNEKSGDTQAETKDQERDEGLAKAAAIEEEDHVADADSTDKNKAPLSKKAKKKKAAAAAAAAAAVAAVSTSSLSKEERSEQDDAKCDTKDDEKAAKARAEAEEQERKEKEAEQKAQAAAVDKMNAEIESLRAQIAASEKSNLTRQEELSSAQVALEAVRDEKASLSSSLEMHVELTMQLQQEIEDLKVSLAQKQKREANGATLKGSPELYDNDLTSARTRSKSAQGTAKGDSTPQRAATPVPSATPSTEESKPATAAAAKNESTQVDKIDAVDKAVQSEDVEQVDESTQADFVQNTEVAAGGDGDDVKEAKSDQAGKEGKEGKDTVVSRRSIDNALSRRSIVVGEVDQETMQLTSDASLSSTVNNTNQSNREFLIKKHYETKVQNITEQLQLSDGRYARLHREFGLLKELLLETAKEKEALTKDMEQLRVKNEHLQEELASAKEDNRAQVETMTNFMKSLDQGQGR